MIVFLAVVVGALAVAVGVLIYQRSNPPTPVRQPGSGAAGILRGILAAYTGGATLALSGGGRSGGGILGGGSAGAGAA